MAGTVPITIIGFSRENGVVEVASYDGFAAFATTQDRTVTLTAERGGEAIEVSATAHGPQAAVAVYMAAGYALRRLFEAPEGVLAEEWHWDGQDWVMDGGAHDLGAADVYAGDTPPL